MESTEEYLQRKHEEYQQKKKEKWSKETEPHFVIEVEHRVNSAREEFYEAWEVITEKITKYGGDAPAEQEQRNVLVRQRESLEIQIRARVETYYEILYNCMK
jgi:hypothetical protein